MKTTYSRKSFLVAGFFILVMPLLFWQCDQHEKIAGKYHAVDESLHGRTLAILELQDDGKGLWSIETDNAPFRWDLRQNKIRLHTRSGGVIEGTIRNGTIQIALPGTGIIQFEHAN